jgi:hypothetical protein
MVAACEPAKFLAACVQLMPKDVAISAQIDVVARANAARN